MEKKVPLWQEKGARTLQVGPGAWPVVLRTLRVVGAFPVPRGAAPRCPARPRAGARLSLEESRRKEHQGGRGSSSLDPPFLVGGTLVGSLFFFCLACGPVSYVRNGPPRLGGLGRWFLRREGFFSPPKPSLGEGGPAKPGRMRGRSCTQPFLVEKGALPAVAPTGFFSCPVGQPGRPLIRPLR